MIFRRLLAASAGWTAAPLADVGATRSQPTAAPIFAPTSARVLRRLAATGPVRYLYWIKICISSCHFYRL